MTKATKIILTLFAAVFVGMAGTYVFTKNQSGVMTSTAKLFEDHGWYTVRTVTAAAVAGELSRTPKLPSALWLDNERLAFIGIETDPALLAVARDSSNPGPLKGPYLFVWNDTTQKLQKMVKLAQNGAMYFDGDQLLLITEDGKFRQGRIEQDAFVTTNELTEIFPPEGSGREFNVFSAKTVSTQNKPTLRDHRVVTLREGDGWLAFPAIGGPGGGDNSSLSPVKWFPADGSAAVELPMAFITSFMAKVVYSDFKKRYVILDPLSLHDASGSGIGKRKEGDPELIYLWRPLQKVEQVALPLGPFRSFADALPVKLGIAIVTGDTVPVNHWFKHGVYLNQSEKITQLASGHPSAYAVSPDGCKIAAGLQKTVPTSTVWYPYHLHIINLCTKEVRK